MKLQDLFIGDTPESHLYKKEIITEMQRQALFIELNIVMESGKEGYIPTNEKREKKLLREAEKEGYVSRKRFLFIPLDNSYHITDLGRQVHRALANVYK